MGSFSIWHLLIPLVLLGAPVAMYFLVTSGTPNQTHRPLQFLHGSFWVWAIGLLAIVVSTIVETDVDSVATQVGVLAMALVVAAWTYLISLAVLAHRIGKNWISWAGLTFITSGIGVVVSYCLMIGALKEHERRRANAA